MSGLPFPLFVTCRQCKHLVEVAVTFEDHASMQLMIRVECHGERDEQPVPRELLLDKSITILAVEAFQPRIESHAITIV